MLDCEKPNIGEKATRLFLQKCGYTVLDVSKNPFYQEQGYDFLARNQEKEYRIESKYDTYLHRTGCIFFETSEVIIRTNEMKPGWGEYSKADYLFYLEPYSLTLYIFDMREVQEYVKHHDLPQRTTNKDGYKETYGRLVSIKDYEKEYSIKAYDISDLGPSL